MLLRELIVVVLLVVINIWIEFIATRLDEISRDAISATLQHVDIGSHEGTITTNSTTTIRGRSDHGLSDWEVVGCFLLPNTWWVLASL